MRFFRMLIPTTEDTLSQPFDIVSMARLIAVHKTFKLAPDDAVPVDRVSG